jgi:hypothetical protein
MTARVAFRRWVTYDKATSYMGLSYRKGLSYAIHTGGRLPPLLGRSSYLTLGRGGLKHGIQGILPNQPLLANFDRGELTPLNFSSNRIGLHAQDFRRLSRGIELRFAHAYITPSLPVYMEGKMPEISRPSHKVGALQ